jgi:hypothetical protein
LQNLTEQLYFSYLDARKNKRNTHNQLAFELDLEHNLCTLAAQIYTNSYQPKPAIAFIVNKPVQREIFAADFADRVVHHLIYRCLYHKHVDPFFIKVTGLPSGSAATFSLFTVLGKEVLATKFIAQNVQEISLPTSLSAGVYIVNVASDLGTFHKKIIVE